MGGTAPGGGVHGGCGSPEDQLWTGNYWPRCVAPQRAGSSGHHRGETLAEVQEGEIATETAFWRRAGVFLLIPALEECLGPAALTVSRSIQAALPEKGHIPSGTHKATGISPMSPQPWQR